MGLFFTLFYVFTAFVGPQTIFGDLAEYHIQIVIALITLACSLPAAAGSGLLRMPQPYAIVGLSAAVLLSLAFNGWIGGGPIALMEFIPNAMAFFFVLWNCRKKSHLQMLAAVLFCAALFTIFKAWYALHTGDLASPYLLTMPDEHGGEVVRIRGLSFISDPNDLAQFMVGLVPCMFLFWASGRTFRNSLLVYLPIAILIYGMFLSHSRGGMVALLAVAIVAGRRKLGVVPSVAVGALLFVGLSAAGFSGGRDVSAASGSDRMDAWGVGLELIRTHPLFGVGFRRFAEFNDLTAHNTVVVCAAELGLIGFFFWMWFILPTVRDAVAGSGDGRADAEKKNADLLAQEQFPARSPSRVHSVASLVPVNGSAAMLAGNGRQVSLRAALNPWTLAPGKTRTPAVSGTRVLSGAPYGTAASEEQTNQPSDAEIHRISGLMVVSFAGFLTAGWFLSRAYVMTLYINAGMAEVVYRMARERGIAPPLLSFPRSIKLSLYTCAGFLLLVYVILRVSHFMPK